MATARAGRVWRIGEAGGRLDEAGTGRGWSEESTRSMTPLPRARCRSWVAMVGNRRRIWTRVSWLSSDLNSAPGIAPLSRAARRWGARIRAAATASWRPG